MVSCSSPELGWLGVLGLVVMSSSSCAPCLGGLLVLFLDLVLCWPRSRHACY